MGGKRREGGVWLVGPKSRLRIGLGDPVFWYSDLQCKLKWQDVVNCMLRMYTILEIQEIF